MTIVYVYVLRVFMASVKFSDHGVCSDAGWLQDAMVCVWDSDGRLVKEIKGHQVREEADKIYACMYMYIAACIY